MACECSTACKAAISTKKTNILTLINSLSTSGVTAELLAPIYSYLLDEVNRLQAVTRRLEDMQKEIANEVASTELASNIVYGVTEQLKVIRASSEADYTTLSTIFNITLPEEEE